MRIPLKKTKPEKQEGKIVSAYGNQITWICVDGDDWQHILRTDTKITLDGKSSQLKDLKVGMPVRVTVCDKDNSKASCISAETIKSVPYT